MPPLRNDKERRSFWPNLDKSECGIHRGIFLHHAGSEGVGWKLVRSTASVESRKKSVDAARVMSFEPIRVMEDVKRSHEREPDLVGIHSDGE